MGSQESNPIQQRMELLAEKWEKLISPPEVSIVRILAQENEKDMVDAFYSYLLGIDTINHDIPIIFNSIFHDGDQYTNALLEELNEMIEDWNCTSKENVDVVIQHLDWKADFDPSGLDEPAHLFIRNLNSLAEHLRLQDKIFLVPVLRISFTSQTPVLHWLQEVLEAGVHEKVRIAIDDTVSNPYFQKLVDKNPGQVVTLVPDLDMDNAMQQLAAMGNPNDPAVQYRKAFMLMMQSIEKRKEKETEKNAGECIRIAEENIEKNKFWIGQIIAVNSALANDQVGYRNFRKAIEFASRAVTASERSKELIDDESVFKKFQGQAYMLRASLYAAAKDWLKATEDFSIAAAHYEDTKDMILALEAYRMLGFCFDKAGDNDAACKALSDAVFSSAEIPEHVIRYTTFAGVIDHLFEINNEKYIIQQELEGIAESVYGEDWVDEIRNWKNPHYEPQNDPTKAMY